MDIIKKFEPLFGGWHAEKLIGAGSYGRVYKVSREEFGEKYYSAIKYIPIPGDAYEVTSLRDDGMDDESIKAYYTALARDVSAETRMMSRLKGLSNIVSLEDSSVIPRKDGVGYDVFIRMELLESLSERTRRSSLSQREVVSLGIDICTALEICGEEKIIHRDIKPDNIFVNFRGDFKLGDFGIARQLEKTATFMSKKGTYNYMAPEVYKGEKYGSTCDVYSLGLVMYRLLNKNRLPFLPPHPKQITPTDRENALMDRLAGKPIAPPLNADTDVARIILKACAYEPADRYHTPKEMKEALLRWQYSMAAESPKEEPQADASSAEIIADSVAPKAEAPEEKAAAEKTPAEKAAEEKAAEEKAPESETADSGDRTVSLFAPAAEPKVQPAAPKKPPAAGKTEAAAEKPASSKKPETAAEKPAPVYHKPASKPAEPPAVATSGSPAYQRRVQRPAGTAGENGASGHTSQYRPLYPKKSSLIGSGVSRMKRKISQSIEQNAHKISDEDRVHEAETQERVRAIWDIWNRNH